MRGRPRFIQVARHFFMESVLLELFATAKIFGWYDSIMMYWNLTRFLKIFQGYLPWIAHIFTIQRSPDTMHISAIITKHIYACGAPPSKWVSKTRWAARDQHLPLKFSIKVAFPQWVGPSLGLARQEGRVLRVLPKSYYLFATDEYRRPQSTVHSSSPVDLMYWTYWNVEPRRPNSDVIKHP